MLASVHHELAKTLQEGMILQFFGHSIMSSDELYFSNAIKNNIKNDITTISLIDFFIGS